MPVLLVTGGSRGIGAAIVKAAARQGYQVCFTYRQNHEAAKATAAQAPGSTYLQGDLTDPAFPNALIRHAEQTLGPVTALVNNAAITGPLGPFAAVTDETLQKVIETNLTGTLRMAREAIRHWQAAATPGNMVNISSAAATLGAPHEYVHYAATKAAIEAFTIGLGKELAPTGTRINAVSPGTTQTEIHAAAGDSTRPARLAPRIPLARVAAPEEIAAAVLWLLSPESSYVTATVLRVAGGL